MWSVGQRIGDYELVANLRAGGMATLFLARRTGAAGFSREVAIKIVHPQLASDDQFRQMFLDEALLSSRIQHPNVVHVEELGEHEGSHFLVMEFVHGCSLSQLQRALVARGRRLAPPFAVRIAMHVADGLHAAHETRDEQGRLLNVVHRDVSPENVLLAYAGHVKLIDFGIAKAYGRRHQTQEGLLKGKFRYMAPEQAYGKPVDRRTDIYQLGIVLWEMLTLRRLFDAETDVDLIAQVRDPRIAPPSALVDRIPPALDAAVMAALDPEPRRRPPDAQTFARMLGKAVNAAHDVDGGALSALLVATMQEHRQREKGTYPPGVYERLDQQVQTLQVAGGAAPQSAAPALKQYTLEHTSPYGSDVSGEAARSAPEKRVRKHTEPGFGSPGRGASQRPPAPAGAPLQNAQRMSDGGPRRRRLVRLASDLRTTITRMADGDPQARRLVWLAIGGAIGLAGALALITVALRTRAPVTGAPPPPTLMAPPAPVLTPVTTPGTAQVVAPSAAPEPAAVPVVTSDAGAALEPAFVVPPKPRPALLGDRPKEGPAGRLPAPVDVDGTPIVTEPGF